MPKTIFMNQGHEGIFCYIFSTTTTLILRHHPPFSFFLSSAKSFYPIREVQRETWIIRATTTWKWLKIRQVYYRTDYFVFNSTSVSILQFCYFPTKDKNLAKSSIINFKMTMIIYDAGYLSPLSDQIATIYLVGRLSSSLWFISLIESMWTKSFL